MLDEGRCTDAGNADRFAAKFKDRVRYCKRLKSWFIWDEKRFAPDITGRIIELAKEVALDIYDEAANVEGTDKTAAAQREQLSRWAIKSEDGRRLREMVYLAESDRRLAITPDELDRDPWLLNVQNGTLDLRTCTLRESHDVGDLITRITPVPYDPTARCDEWIKFMTTIMCGRQDLVDYLQEICGVSLIGRCSEQKLFILIGEGRNGKTTFLEVYCGVLGPDYASSVPLRALTAGSHDEHPTALASFKRLRFMYAVEPKKSAKFDDGAIKSITGGDDQQTRKMRQNYSGGKVNGTLLLALNNPPATSDNSVAMKDRLRLIPFDFYIDPNKRDVMMESKLLAESAGILAWAVEGLKRWTAAGRRFTSEPDDVLNKSREFWQRQDPKASTISALPTQVEECFMAADDRLVPMNTGQSYQAHVTWCQESNLEPLGRTTFYGAMEALGYRRGEIDKAGTVGWPTLALRPQGGGGKS